VIPNLLTYKGSAVVLDVKGENFRETSRFRASMGDKVFRFAPTDWDRPTHRYNPLARIAAMTNPDRQQMELKLTAKLFLQTDNEKLSGLLAGGIDLFVAAGLLAFERGVPTIGEIYRITASGGDKQKEYLKRSQEVKNTSAKLIFERMASTNNDTLTSYLSLLMTSGLDTWDNRAIDAATATSDFSFRDIRRRPNAIYLVVESEMIRPLAPLIRLFFSDLIASLQAQEPGDDEPWPVMIMLDEFDRLGKMPIVAESIKTLRSFGGNLAIVTQTIPALDEIYGENTRRSLQGGAGVKLYLTPSEQKTIEELSQAVGKTTKRVVTRSRAVGRNPFEGRSVSERTEDTPLLTEDQARRMDLDEVILVIDAQMPIRARRVKYFEDPALKVLHTGQAGSFPYPDEDGLRRDRQMTETRETVEKLKQELQAVRAAAGAQGPEANALPQAAQSPSQELLDPKPAPPGRARGRAARAAAGRAGSDQLSFDLAGLGLRASDGIELAAAVQTTRAIIEAHG
jgi:type IV secretion system protein VirD4